MDLLTGLIYSIILYCTYKILDFLIRIPNLRRVDDKYILVTGCDSGFGYDIASRLDKLGCYVFATCMSEAGETKLRKQSSARLCTLHMDVTNAESIQKTYNHVVDALPKEKGLWSIVNNAGVYTVICPEEWRSLEDYQQVLDVNLFGMIAVTKAFLPLVKRRGGGRIVNMSSMTGRVSLPRSTPYTISKYAIEAYSDSLRRQLNVYNISVHLIEPGGYQTQLIQRDLMGQQVRDIWNKLPGNVKDEFGEDYRDALIKGINAGFIQSKQTYEVIKAYEHALLGRYPRTRYVIGLESKLTIIVASWFPDWLCDVIFGGLRRSRGLTPKAVLAGHYPQHA